MLLDAAHLLVCACGIAVSEAHSSGQEEMAAAAAGLLPELAELNLRAFCSRYPRDNTSGALGDRAHGYLSRHQQDVDSAHDEYEAAKSSPISSAAFFKEFCVDDVPARLMVTALGCFTYQAMDAGDSETDPVFLRAKRAEEFFKQRLVPALQERPYMDGFWTLSGSAQEILQAYHRAVNEWVGAQIY